MARKKRARERDKFVATKCTTPSRTPVRVEADETWGYRLQDDNGEPVRKTLTGPFAVPPGEHTVFASYREAAMYRDLYNGGPTP